MDRNREIAQALSRIENKLSSPKIQRAAINCSTAGNNTIVAAVSGKQIKVLSLLIFPGGGDATLRFESGAGGTALTGQMKVDVNNVLFLPPTNVGMHYFETAPGELLNLENAEGRDCDGFILYIVE